MPFTVFSVYRPHLKEECSPAPCCGVLESCMHIRGRSHTDTRAQILHSVIITESLKEAIAETVNDGMAAPRGGFAGMGRGMYRV